ncbi:permease-like cell division protein FtsX [Porticoccaceae bacterium LTM1]|nr:permease-like cell division protein FtsX [Porticoccaceae bacterium LTM1]
MNSRTATRKEVARGARESRTGLFTRLHSWLHHHRQSALNAWKKMVLAPVQALMTTLVIAIALSLPTALYVVVENIQQFTSGIESTAQVTLYLKQGIKQDAVDGLMKKLDAHESISQVTFISANQALSEFQNLSGLGDSLQLLESNPLPAVIMVQPTLADNAAVIETLAEELRQWGGIDDVRLDMKWVQRLHAILEAGRRLAVALAIALSLGVLLVVGNTIRLAVQNRRDEIVVVKLVGGTDGYVRRPFLYTGLWYGAVGGALAWLLIGVSMLWLSGAVSKLSGLYQSGFSLNGPGMDELGLLLFGGALLGLLGSWLAVGRHLREMEPG